MTAQNTGGAGLNLSGLLAALSLSTDLGMNHPPEEAIRACLLATGLASIMDVTSTELRDIYYSTLLEYVGCTAYAHEEARLFGGDDISGRAAASKVDVADSRQLLSFLLFGLARDASPLRRVAVAAGAMYHGTRMGDELARSHCEVGSAMAHRLGLPAGVRAALYQMFERWDGKGEPQRLRGDDIALGARFAPVASTALIFYRAGGLGAAQEIVSAWSGGMFDPAICAVFQEHGPELLAEIDASDAWSEVVVREPQPGMRIPESGIDVVARAFGDMADLKLPFTRGHSIAVAELARDAAGELGLDNSDVACVYRAGLLQDLGRVSVPNGIWEKRGPLTMADWERVRLHAYHSERILSCSPVIAPVARLAGSHHERLDGSGYHRQITATALPITARLLATADAYQAMTSNRPHRPALEPEAAARELGEDVKRGRLDGEAVDAVLSAAGLAASTVHRTWPSGLSDREVEVLRLISHGLSNREVARDLSISPKTAGHHVQHIYDKIGVSTRAAAAMFAMEHDILTR